MRTPRSCAAAAAIAVVVASFLVLAVAPAGAVAVSVGDEATLRAKFADPTVTQITLTTSITLTDCTGTKELLRDAVGSADLVVDGAGFTIAQTCADARVMHVQVGALTLQNVIVTGGSLTSGAIAEGGGVYAAGDLTLSNAVLVANAARGTAISSGGGAYVMGDLTVADSVVTQNTAGSTAGTIPEGGGIYRFGNDGTVTITNSTITDNDAVGTAGGIASGGGLYLFANDASGPGDLDVAITGSTITGNDAAHVGSGIADGGGVYAFARGALGLTIVSSTVGDNTARTGDGAVIAEGGGVYAFSADTTVEVSGSSVSGNTAAVADGNGYAQGGGIYAIEQDGDAAVSLVDSTVQANQAYAMEATQYGEADGGGVMVRGALTATRSTIAQNVARGFTLAAGGGAWAQQVVLDSSTVRDNVAAVPARDALSRGGGVAGGGVQATNSTVTGNEATGGDSADDTIGGGLDAMSAAQVVYSTITANSAATYANVHVGPTPARGVSSEAALAAGLEAAGVPPERVDQARAGTDDVRAEAVVYPFTAFGSVVADPQGGGTNCGGQTATTSNGYNRADDTSCGFAAATDLQATGFDPLLGALGSNGGPTETSVPQPGSPLIDAVPAASCQDDGAAGITTDQRGEPRPSGPGCDIGAVEVQQPTEVQPVVELTPTFTG